MGESTACELDLGKDLPIPVAPAAVASCLSSRICIRSCRRSLRRSLSSDMSCGTSDANSGPAIARRPFARARDGELALLMLPREFRPEEDSGPERSLPGLMRGRHAAAATCAAFGSVLILLTESSTSLPETLLKSCGDDRVLLARVRAPSPAPSAGGVGRRVLGEASVGRTPPLLARLLSSSVELTGLAAGARRFVSQPSILESRKPLSIVGGAVVSRIFSPILTRISSSCIFSIWVCTPPRICAISSPFRERRPYRSSPRPTTCSFTSPAL
mmetsp:Transcript_53662/g.117020  ORF Transcript_53662/g.117020 Transcript_53662/m.117020 type:complete len:272 (+) Transcript_53662:227-1042(+)